MKKHFFILLCVLLTASFFGCTKNAPESAAPAPSSTAPTSAPTPSASASAETTVEDYFPRISNMHYIYEGSGFEYAGFDIYIDYTSDTKIQQRGNNTGTEYVNVIEIKDGKAVTVFSRGESYYRESFLNKSPNKNEILLMEPIKVGTSWTLREGDESSITGVGVKIDTPSGSYTTVAVKTDYASGGFSTSYYASGVGLVKEVSNFGGSEITSTLSEIQKDTELKQTIRFYYPNVNDGKLYYKDREISFNTNDITRTIFEEAYKELPKGVSTKVFSDGTKINSLYLNDDGMVYIDLSKEFVTEMTAGSGYESMLLQCVANTFGSYYGAEKVLLTIDGGLYESGHVALKKGEYLTVNTENSTVLS